MTGTRARVADDGLPVLLREFPCVLINHSGHAAADKITIRLQADLKKKLELVVGPAADVGRRISTDVGCAACDCGLAEACDPRKVDAFRLPAEPG